MTVASYVNHCDSEHCDLGVLHYECPVCAKHEMCYDFLQPAVFAMTQNGHRGQFRCEACNAPLVVAWNEGEVEFEIRPYADPEHTY